jgi:hypothetical protein
MVVSPSFGQPWRPGREKINGPKSRNPLRARARTRVQNGGVGRPDEGESKEKTAVESRLGREVYIQYYTAGTPSKM